jgi:hypothetical protein
MFAQPSSHLLDLLEQNPANFCDIGDIHPKGLLLPNALGESKLTTKLQLLYLARK